MKKYVNRAPIIEVRDSRTGYVAPVCDTRGALPDGQTCWDVAAAVSCHLEIQVDVQAKNIYLEFVIWLWGRGDRYLRMHTGVLLGISMQIS